MHTLLIEKKICLWLGFKVYFEHTAGADDVEVPPVPIPNTVVKLDRAEDTWMATSWENR